MKYRKNAAYFFHFTIKTTYGALIRLEIHGVIRKNKIDLLKKEIGKK